MSFPNLELEALPWTEIENSIIEWINKITHLTVVWGKQDISFPPYPYCVVKLVSGPNRINTRDSVFFTSTDDFVKKNYSDHREFLISVQVWDVPNKPKPPAVYINDLLTSRQTDAVAQFFSEKNISLIDTTNITDVSMTVGSKWISIVNCDMTFYAISSLSEVTSFIDTENVTQIE